MNWHHSKPYLWLSDTSYEIYESGTEDYPHYEIWYNSSLLTHVRTLAEAQQFAEDHLRGFFDELA